MSRAQRGQPGRQLRQLAAQFFELRVEILESASGKAAERDVVAPTAGIVALFQRMTELFVRVAQRIEPIAGVDCDQPRDRVGQEGELNAQLAKFVARGLRVGPAADRFVDQPECRLDLFPIAMEPDQRRPPGVECLEITQRVLNVVDQRAGRTARDERLVDRCEGARQLATFMLRAAPFRLMSSRPGSWFKTRRKLPIATPSRCASPVLFAVSSAAAADSMERTQFAGGTPDGAPCSICFRARTLACRSACTEKNDRQTDGSAGNHRALSSSCRYERLWIVWSSSWSCL